MFFVFCVKSKEKSKQDFIDLIVKRLNKKELNPPTIIDGFHQIFEAFIKYLTNDSPNKEELIEVINKNFFEVLGILGGPNNIQKSIERNKKKLEEMKSFGQEIVNKNSVYNDEKFKEYKKKIQKFLDNNTEKTGFFGQIGNIFNKKDDSKKPKQEVSEETKQKCKKLIDSMNTNTNTLCNDYNIYNDLSGLDNISEQIINNIQINKPLSLYSSTSIDSLIKILNNFQHTLPDKMDLIIYICLSMPIELLMMKFQIPDFFDKQFKVGSSIKNYLSLQNTTETNLLECLYNFYQCKTRFLVYPVISSMVKEYFDENTRKIIKDIVNKIKAQVQILEPLVIEEQSQEELNPFQIVRNKLKKLANKSTQKPIKGAQIKIPPEIIEKYRKIKAQTQQIKINVKSIKKEVPEITEKGKQLIGDFKNMAHRFLGNIKLLSMTLSSPIINICLSILGPILKDIGRHIGFFL